MGYQERRNSRLTKIASTNLTMALTMISIETGLLAFIFTSYSNEILGKVGNLTPFILYEGGPIIWIPLHDIMILLITLSIFSFTFSFMYSHDALETHAKTIIRNGKILPEAATNIEKFYYRGLLGVKVGVSLLLGFVLSLLIQIFYTLFTFFFCPVLLVLLYVLMYAYFLILLWLRPINRRRGQKR